MTGFQKLIPMIFKTKKNLLSIRYILINAINDNYTLGMFTERDLLNLNCNFNYVFLKLYYIINIFYRF